MPLDVKAAIGRELTPERMTPRDEASTPPIVVPIVILILVLAAAYGRLH